MGEDAGVDRDKDKGVGVGVGEDKTRARPKILHLLAFAAFTLQVPCQLLSSKPCPAPFRHLP